MENSKIITRVNSYLETEIIPFPMIDFSSLELKIILLLIFNLAENFIL